MKIRLLAVGRTDDKKIQHLTDAYASRLKHYIRFELEEIPDLKNTKSLSLGEQREKEGELILKRLDSGDQVLLLDERGKEYRSVEFADFLQKKMNAGTRQLVLVIGGPFGFSEAVYKRSDGSVSLSKMTFSHQMVRLFITEQLYRAFTILKNEPYHHE